MALSLTPKVVTFCFGGTPAVLHISVFDSDLCWSYWWKENHLGKIKTWKQNATFGLWHFKINHGPSMTAGEPNRHTHTWHWASLTFAFTQLALIWAPSVSLHSLSPLLLTENQPAKASHSKKLCLWLKSDAAVWEGLKTTSHSTIRHSKYWHQWITLT